MKKSKKLEHDSFNLDVKNDGAILSEAYSGTLVIQTLEEYRKKNKKELSLEHGGSGDYDAAVIIARHIAGEKLVDIKIALNCSKGKVDRAVSLRYSDDVERILDIYNRFSYEFTKYGVGRAVLEKWISTKRAKLEASGRLIDSCNPNRSKKYKVDVVEELVSIEGIDWACRDGETIFLDVGTEISIMKSSYLAEVLNQLNNQDKEIVTLQLSRDIFADEAKKLASQLCEVDEGRKILANELVSSKMEYIKFQEETFEQKNKLLEANRKLQSDLDRCNSTLKHIKKLNSEGDKYKKLYYESKGKIKVLESELNKANKKLAILCCYFGADRKVSSDAIISASNRAIGFLGAMRGDSRVLGKGGEAVLASLTVNIDTFLEEIEKNAKYIDDCECVNDAELDGSIDSNEVIENTDETSEVSHELTEEQIEQLNNGLNGLFLNSKN